MAPKTDMERVKKFAKAFESNGGEWKAAMIEAGYPESRANRGKAGANKAMISAVAQQLCASAKELVEVGKAMKDADLLENLVLGAGVDGVLTKDSGGIPAAKLLATHESVAQRFKPEVTIQGMIVLAAPPMPKPREVAGEVIEVTELPEIAQTGRLLKDSPDEAE